jgi:hypothetical protein
MSALSKADICSARSYVRFAPDSDHESRHAAMVMSALHLKADMCGAAKDVCFGPIADICVAKWNARLPVKPDIAD